MSGSAQPSPASIDDEAPTRDGRAAAAKIAARAAGRGSGPQTARTVAQRAPQTAARPAPARAAASQPATPAEPALGFDPGDEPTDDVLDAASARQSVEQQAVESLRQQFSVVEKIADL